jgi:hypothetical protein
MHGERIVNEALRIVAGGEPRPTTRSAASSGASFSLSPRAFTWAQAGIDAPQNKLSEISFGGGYIAEGPFRCRSVLLPTE